MKSKMTNDQWFVLCHVETDDKQSTLDTLQHSSEASSLSNFSHGRPIICNVFNFLRGFFLHNTYTESSTFNTSKGQNISYWFAHILTYTYTRGNFMSSASPVVLFALFLGMNIGLWIISQLRKLNLL